MDSESENALPRLPNRAAFKTGRRVHFAPLRKMLNSPIAHLPAIVLDFTNHPSGETDYIYEANVK